MTKRTICRICGGTQDPELLWATLEDEGVWGGQGPCGDLHQWVQVPIEADQEQEAAP
jgi:hypothetical protein